MGQLLPLPGQLPEPRVEQLSQLSEMGISLLEVDRDGYYPYILPSRWVASATKLDPSFVEWYIVDSDLNKRVLVIGSSDTMLGSPVIQLKILDGREKWGMLDSFLSVETQYYLVERICSFSVQRRTTLEKMALATIYQQMVNLYNCLSEEERSTHSLPLCKES